jgi:hypothetical protein
MGRAGIGSWDGLVHTDGGEVAVTLEIEKSGASRLNGSLIAFSRRHLYTGPLSHWVDFSRE